MLVSTMENLLKFRHDFAKWRRHETPSHPGLEQVETSCIHFRVFSCSKAEKQDRYYVKCRLLDANFSACVYTVYTSLSLFFSFFSLSSLLFSSVILFCAWYVMAFPCCMRVTSPSAARLS